MIPIDAPNPQTETHRVSQLRALRRVLRDRFAEIDRDIQKSYCERDRAQLWRVRKTLRDVWRALVGLNEK